MAKAKVTGRKLTDNEKVTVLKLYVDEKHGYSKIGRAEGIPIRAIRLFLEAEGIKRGMPEASRIARIRSLAGKTRELPSKRREKQNGCGTLALNLISMRQTSC